MNVATTRMGPGGCHFHPTARRCAARVSLRCPEGPRSGDPGWWSPHDWHSICAKLAAPLDRTCCTAGLGRPSGEAADRSGAVSRVIRNGQARSIVRPWNFPTIDCPDAESLQLNIGVHDVPSVLTAAGFALV
jgi:hypothetical protein